MTEGECTYLTHTSDSSIDFRHCTHPEGSSQIKKQNLSSILLMANSHTSVFLYLWYSARITYSFLTFQPNTYSPNAPAHTQVLSMECPFLLSVCLAVFPLGCELLETTDGVLVSGSPSPTAPP